MLTMQRQSGLACFLIFAGSAWAAAPCVASQPAGSIQWSGNGHYYALTNVAQEFWTSANAEAIARSGYLVSILSQVEQDFIYGQFGSRPYLWIGYNDITAEGTFVWSSGEPGSYTNWYPGEPNNDGGIEDVTIMVNVAGRNGRWQDGTNFSGGGFFGVIEFTPCVDRTLKLTLDKTSVPPSRRGHSDVTVDHIPFTITKEDHYVISTVKATAGANPISTTVSFKVEIDDIRTIGGHNHVSPPPPPITFIDVFGQTTTSCKTDSSSGECSVLLVAPDVSGSYIVVASSADAQDQTKGLLVAAPGLFQMTFTPPFTIPSGFKPIHPSNHFGSLALNARLVLLSSSYYANKRKALVINDMSLPSGGIFDLDANWRAPRHVYHQTGHSVDIERMQSPPLTPGDQKFLDGLARILGFIRVQEPQLHYELLVQ